MYTTRVKLKPEQFINNRWIISYKLAGSPFNNDGITAVSTNIVEFVTHTIESAIANINLNEIEELHITKNILL